MDKDLMIGAIVITDDGDEGMIIDRVRDNCTMYLIMTKKKEVISIDYDGISEIISLNGGNPLYFTQEPFKL